MKNGRYVARELFRLQGDPSDYIIYPGGYAFYIHEDVELGLNRAGHDASIQDIEELFWPYVRADVRNRLEHYYSRGSRLGRKPLSREEEDAIRDHVHTIDKRRLNYIRLQQMDQTKLGRVPEKFYRPLLHKSRDELEQYFIREEAILKPHEYRTYVFSFFNLRRHFYEVFAGDMPEALDQEMLDAFFLEEICDLNSDPAFWGGESIPDSLHAYLVRYLIMYFDNPFAKSRFYENILNDFINRNRFHRVPPKRRTITLEQSSKVFGVPRDELKSMSKRELVRLYRKLALKHHPDQGGKDDAFIELTETFKALVRMKRSRTF